MASESSTPLLMVLGVEGSVLGLCRFLEQSAGICVSKSVSPLVFQLQGFITFSFVLH